MDRIGVVVHPTRPLERPLDTLRRWTSEHGLDLVQLAARGDAREVAPPGTVDGCDLVVAIGGDGTALAALRAAAETDTPVIGVACGSLGILTAVSADDLAAVLDSAADGSCRRIELPALAVGGPDGPNTWALNDFVVTRRGTNQLVVAIKVDGELYARVAGDGLIVSTPLGSSAYSMAAGGPIVLADAKAFLCTPLARHGGCAPPLLVPSEATLQLEVQPGYGGVEFQVDGQRAEGGGSRLELTLDRSRATLLSVAGRGHGLLSRLRTRGLIVDSPRARTREERSNDRAQGG